MEIEVITMEIEVKIQNIWRPGDQVIECIRLQLWKVRIICSKHSQCIVKMWNVSRQTSFFDNVDSSEAIELLITFKMHIDLMS